MASRQFTGHWQLETGNLSCEFVLCTLESEKPEQSHAADDHHTDDDEHHVLPQAAGLQRDLDFDGSAVNAHRAALDR